MMYGMGMLESGITFDYGQLILDCENARMIKHTIQGIPVSDETLALDAIKEIGPGGHFLMHKTTLKGMRSQSKPEILDRKSREIWEKGGSTSAYERALTKACWIMEHHKLEPKPQDVLDQIRTIVEEAEKEMGIQ